MTEETLDAEGPKPLALVPPWLLSMALEKEEELPSYDCLEAPKNSRPDLQMGKEALQLGRRW